MLYKDRSVQGHFSVQISYKLNINYIEHVLASCVTVGSERVNKLKCSQTKQVILPPGKLSR